MVIYNMEIFLYRCKYNLKNICIEKHSIHRNIVNKNVDKLLIEETIVDEQSGK